MADDRTTSNSPELVIGRFGGTRLTLGWPTRPDPRSTWVQMLVTLEGQDFTARGELDLEEWGGGSVAFVAYVDSLAVDWRGWVGERTWEDDQGNIRLRATHNGIGYVFLDVSLFKRAGKHADEAWSVNAIVTVDAGQLESAAKRLRTMVAGVVGGS